MIPAEVLSGAYSYGARVDSWLGSRWLGQVPVAGGSVSWTTDQQVQGSLSLTVPRTGAASALEDERDWAPVRWDSPLACCGQVLRVVLTVVSLVDGAEYSYPGGQFLVTSTEVGSGTVSVTGKSLLHRVEEDRLTRVVVPRPGGSVASEARRLLAGHMGLVIDKALVNRWCPTSMSWGESRIDALYEIADAWPARLREGRDGVLYLLPPLDEVTTPPERVLTDGQDGTVVGVRSSWDRTQVYNRVVARAQDSDDEGQPTFQAVAEQEHGPLSVHGAYGVVTRFFSSPLVTSRPVAVATARTMLASSVRRATTVPVEHAPDPSVGLDDPVLLSTRDVTASAPTQVWGRVSAVEIPLTHEGTARTDVEVEGA
ncbi:hypothetical protein D5R93_05680 [Actinomyces lilanjuaniae]|uniref:Phage tail protein n=1 Tax=Actinomyces lilanjuaniae TaxID=2321394 RepID=A0ABN5PRV3_9ACTO|nr:hypothetical protein [Actinomyces lilanjuaniae]AYD89662.1 hypothetical protein D5R93_05680 [Actinomyces lilanjuaniae]